MSSPIFTGSHPKLMQPGIKALFGQAYAEHPEEFRDLFDVVESNQAFEEDVQTRGFGVMPVKGQGEAVTYAGQAQGYVARYTNVAYALGFIVTYEEIQDNLYPKMAMQRVQSLARSKRQTKEIVAANVYNRAHTSGYTGGDGSLLCVTSHSTLSGNQSNRLSTAADLSEVAIEDLCIQIYGAQDDQGLRIGLQPMSLHVHRNDWFEANRILKSTLQSENANNAINALKSVNALPKGIKMNHYFSDSDAFFIRTDCPDAMKFYNREDIDLRKDNDHDTMNEKQFTYCRFSVGWSDWRGVYSNGGGA